MSNSSAAIGRIFNPTDTPHPTKKRFAVWLLPLAILLGFALLFGLLFRDRLLPAKSVEVVPAIGIEEKIENSPKAASTSGRLLFQASGWVEPDPLPIKATALTDGIVDEVHVLEGELVKKGDLLATLIEIDTRLERDATQAALENMRAAFTAHCTGTQIALARLDSEKAMLAIAEANAAEAGNRMRRYEKITKGAITEDERIAVRFDHTRALAEVEAAQGRIAEITQELNKISYEALAIQSKVRGAEVALEKAELAHSRTRITAPSDGRILALKAAPGQKKMIGMDDPDSATIAILYDPAHLQVRVDVPLADAAGLSVGQRAKIRSNLLPDMVFEGEVTRIEGAADIQRNTLQAKVRIENPSEKLRPEMLCRVEFLEIRKTTTNPVDESMGVAVYVPQSALSDGKVWICDADSQRAEKRAVTSSTSTDGMVRIDSGIRPGEWVVKNPSGLKSGQRLKPLLKD